MPLHEITESAMSADKMIFDIFLSIFPPPNQKNIILFLPLFTFFILFSHFDRCVTQM